MAEWETVDPDDSTDSTPFVGVGEVDGIVYAESQTSPELQWTPDESRMPPPPPVRPAPVPPASQPVAAWKPGPDPAPVSHRSSGGALRVLRLAVGGLVPLAFLLGVVYMMLKVYG